MRVRELEERRLLRNLQETHQQRMRALVSAERATVLNRKGYIPKEGNREPARIGLAKLINPQPGCVRELVVTAS